MDDSTQQQHHHHEVLEMLNQTVHHLSKKNLNVEALGCLEQSLLIKQKMFGTHSRVVRKTLRDVVVQTNAIAMTCLEASEFKTCLDMLLHAQRLLVTEGTVRHIESLHILTLNNLGCCYRRLGKLSEALEVLHEASHVGEGCADNHDVANLSVTHMNICAIESQLGRHEKALEHAQAAVFHCQGELVQDRTSSSSLDEEGEDQALDDVMEAESRDEKIIRLAIAYYNLAVELEFVQKVSMSLQWYKKAMQLIENYRDTHANLEETFRRAFDTAKEEKEKGHPRSRSTSTGTTRTMRRSSQIKKANSMRRTKKPFRPQSASATTRSIQTKSRTKNLKQQQKISASDLVWKNTRRSPRIDVGRVKPNDGPQPQELMRKPCPTTKPSKIPLKQFMKMKSPEWGGFSSEIENQEKVDTGMMRMIDMEHSLSFKKDNVSPPTSGRRSPVIDVGRVKPHSHEEKHAVVADPVQGRMSNKPSKVPLKTILRSKISSPDKESMENLDTRDYPEQALARQESSRSNKSQSPLKYFHELKAATMSSVHRADENEDLPADHRTIKDSVQILDDDSFFQPQGMPNILSLTILKADDSHTVERDPCHRLDADLDLVDTSSITSAQLEANIDQFLDEVDEIHSIAIILIQSWYRGTRLRHHHDLWLSDATTDRESIAAHASIEGEKEVDQDLQNSKSQDSQCKKHRHKTEEKTMAVERSEIRLIATQRIQSWVRSSQSRARVKANRVERMRLYDMQMQEIQFLSCQLIQKHIRGFLVRDRNDREMAQQLARRFILEKHAQIEFHYAFEKEESFLRHHLEIQAPKIQALVRGHLVRIQLRRRKCAAIQCQAMYRGCRSRGFEKRNISRSCDAATVIQALIRGHQSRLMTEFERIENTVAVSKIQALYRGSTWRSKNKMSRRTGKEQDFVAVHQIAATLIQSIIRRFSTQCRYQKIQQEATEAKTIAACVIQYHWKERHQLKQQRLALHEDRNKNTLDLKRPQHPPNSPTPEQALANTEDRDENQNYPTPAFDFDAKDDSVIMGIPPPDQNSHHSQEEVPMVSSDQTDQVSSRETQAVILIQAFIRGHQARHRLLFSVDHDAKPLLSFMNDEEDSGHLSPDEDDHLLSPYLFQLYESFCTTPSFMQGPAYPFTLEELLSMGLNFSSFKYDFERTTSCQDAAAALDGMTCIIHANEKYQSTSYLLMICDLIEKKRKERPDVWDHAIAKSVCWLIYEYQDYL